MQNIQVYHARDQIFQRPQTSYRLYLNTSEALKTPYDTVIMHTYVKALKESLNERLYPALVSGVHFDINAHVDGISIHVDGFNGSAKNALKIILDGLKTMTIDQKHIDIAHTVLRKDWHNKFKSQVYPITFEFLRSVVYKGYVAPDERLDLLDQFGSVKHDELKSFHNKLIKGCEVNMLIYGDTAPDDFDDNLYEYLTALAKKRKIQ